MSEEGFDYSKVVKLSDRKIKVYVCDNCGQSAMFVTDDLRVICADCFEEQPDIKAEREKLMRQANVGTRMFIKYRDKLNDKH